MEAFKVASPGPYTTVQDEGRFGFQHTGIPISGALDAFSFQAANLLAGNPPGLAVLEITILGPRLLALADLDIALCGAEMDLTVNDTPANRWETVRVKAGDLITIGQAKSGCRGYLAVGGGFDVPLVMDSRSTYVGGCLGGYEGRVLKPGDILPVGRKPQIEKILRFPADQIPDWPSEINLKVVLGPQDDFFDEALDVLFRSTYMLTPKADRMGCRLQGPPIAIKENRPQSIISEPTMPGGIQIPADLQPIILLVEQTVGGYAKIATVVTVDLSKVAQATPGDTFRFECVSLEEAHRLFREAFSRIQDITRNLSTQ